MSQKNKFPVNLPKTNFDMRASLVKKEPVFIQQWTQQNLYQKCFEKHQNSPKFIFHDGPPYANGDIHIGTALNKILKDIICRHKYKLGYQISFIPGWDCHGLPIELNTLKSLDKTVESLSPVEIRQKSREYAQKFVNKQRDSFIRLGVLADWKHPYLTMSNDYEASIIEAFGKLVGKGYIYRGQRPIYWSPITQTALADAEVEYHKHQSPTIYTLFPIKSHNIPKLPNNSYILIWTTTPWTLPANTGVAFHPDASYEAVTLNNGNTIIIASDLKDTILSLTSAVEKDSLLLSRINIESLQVSHPWIDRESKVVFADYVTMDAGTGIVHTAPGHGTDDFYTGLKYNLEILSPVDDKGQFTKDVPEWEGMQVFDANPKIIEFLQNKGLVYYTNTITHSYPHDWRTKTPVIFRTKPQWFFKVSDPSLSINTLNALPKVQWLPSWGEDRMRNMLTDRPDWCISRQRKWGVPIIAFYCTDCKEAIIDENIIKQIALRVRKEGLDFWIENSPKDLLPKDFCCPQCQCTNLRKEEDILDVWFDSGSSHYAVLDKNNIAPADLYFEGNDQYRGWFQASLWNSMGIHNRPPFKTVLTHGWVLDENGHQMHKSEGNSVSPNEITDKYGADILRLWTVTEDFTKDLRIGDNLIQKTIDLYRKLRNTFRYLLGTLFDFDNTQIIEYNKLTLLDQYMLHRLSKLKENYYNYMENYQIHRAYREIFNFTIIDLSGEYFDILKDRLYISAPNDPERKSAQTVLHYILQELTLLLSPTLAFTCEEVYQHYSHNNELSVHLLEYIQTPKEWNNESLANDFITLYNIREDSLKKLQNLRDNGTIGSSLEGDIIIECSKELYNHLQIYKKTLKEILIVSNVTITSSDNSEITVTAKSFHPSKPKCERCWHIKSDITDGLCMRCHSIIPYFNK